MAEYIKNFIIAGTICSMFSLLAPSGEEKTGKYLRYISYFIVVLIIAAPIKNISEFITNIKAVTISDSNEEATNSNSFPETVIEKSSENISRYIIETCRDKFKCDTENITVKIILDDSDTENVIIKEVQIFLYGSNERYKNEIRDYFTEKLMCEVHTFGK